MDHPWEDHDVASTEVGIEYGSNTQNLRYFISIHPDPSFSFVSLSGGPSSSSNSKDSQLIRYRKICERDKEKRSQLLPTTGPRVALAVSG
uniref:Uncharacterized protein n=1 Tax=Helianthus annuus TaxID=4232 RepID=A0A251S7X1_HELAN